MRLEDEVRSAWKQQVHGIDPLGVMSTQVNARRHARPAVMHVHGPLECKRARGMPGAQCTRRWGNRRPRGAFQASRASYGAVWWRASRGLPGRQAVVPHMMV